MKKFGEFLWKGIVGVGIVSVALSLNFVYAAWLGPTANPPFNNAYAPINVGGGLQIKSGGDLQIAVSGLLGGGLSSNTFTANSATISGPLIVNGLNGSLTVPRANITGPATSTSGSLSVNGANGNGLRFTTNGTASANHLLTTRGGTTWLYLRDWADLNYKNMALGTLYATVSLGIGDSTPVGASVASSYRLAVVSVPATYGASFAISTDSSDANVGNQFAVLGNGKVGIGTAAVNSSALVQINSTTAGFLPPRMTTGQRNLIASPPAAGLTIYNTSNDRPEYYDGTSWKPVSAGTQMITGFPNAIKCTATADGRNIILYIAGQTNASGANVDITYGTPRIDSGTTLIITFDSVTGAYVTKTGGMPASNCDNMNVKTQITGYDF